VPQIGDKDACCGFANLHSQHAAVFKNTVLHAENGFGFASLSPFVTYLRHGLIAKPEYTPDLLDIFGIKKIVYFFLDQKYAPQTLG